jgi:hypothetical protein
MRNTLRNALVLVRQLENRLAGHLDDREREQLELHLEAAWRDLFRLVGVQLPNRTPPAAIHG